ncbi:hypothetical protein VK792_07825 [Mesobacterium sp. TK19101]|uniref:Uncharacterized protein n=1 Tax=Mesobacterium hydrothermale TaxID=3111907 RepID=A0ABU6HID4_9RHOB|nr:hypothetical protein [Mesobacterium sp. TK19101]MEC3861188.1 hypothetical protein [Mesobacterium sp. TK19101]
MAIDLLKQFEDVPAAYPDPPAGLSADAAALDTDLIWGRIEAYCAHRWTPREVVWTILGDVGDQWHPPLTPVVSREAHFWGDQWEGLTLLDGPLGICLPFDGTYKITAQVGGGDVPAPVLGAFTRLAEYSADTEERAGATDYSVNLGGAIQENFSRYPSWLARAMQYSGAADLLRPYRRA